MKNQTPSDRTDSRHDLPVKRQSDEMMKRGQARLHQVSGSAQPSQGDGISPAIVLRVFQQWWKWVLPAGLLLSVAAGAIVIKLHVPQYESMAMIMIEASEPYIAFHEGGAQRGGGRFIATQVELIRSDLIVAPVTALPEVANLPEFIGQVEPVMHLKKYLAIEQVGKSELYLVRYTSPSPQAAATVANAIVTEYIKEQSDVEFRQAQRVITLLEDEKRKRSRDIERLRARLVEMAKNLTGKDPFGHGAITDVDRAYGSTASIYSNLISSELQIELLKAEIQSLQETQMLSPDELDSPARMDREIAGNKKVLETQAYLEELDDRMEYIKDEYLNWETNKKYLELTELQQEAVEELEQLQVDVREQLQEDWLREKDTRQAKEIATKEKQLAKFLVKKEMWSKKFEDSISELKEGGAQSVQFQFAKAELAREERVFELIAARKLALQTELRAPPRVASKQKAAVPSTPLEKIPLKMLLVACASTLVLPFGLVLLKELMARKIVGTEQLHQVARIPILGEVARFPVRPVAEGPKRLPRRQQREMFVFAESIDSLRTNLVLTENLGAEGRQHVIAIASAASGEGKTSVATSLAVSIAGATKKPTLIVDADLRSPDVAQVLGVTEYPGLSEVLTGKSSLSDAIHASGEPNTYVLPAGRNRANPHHVINGAKVELLFESLRSKFATVIIDTPPVLGASEALVYAKAADLVVFCSLTDVSRAKQVTAAVQRLQSTGADIAGAVLSGISTHRYAYSYGIYGDEEA